MLEKAKKGHIDKTKTQVIKQVARKVAMSKLLLTPEMQNLGHARLHNRGDFRQRATEYGNYCHGHDHNGAI